jgi:hypothetical protein
VTKLASLKKPKKQNTLTMRLEKNSSLKKSEDFEDINIRGSSSKGEIELDSSPIIKLNDNSSKEELKNSGNIANSVKELPKKKKKYSKTTKDL